VSEPLIALSGTALLWIKAGHVIAVIAWMAGMLYLPRLFVYHVDATPGTVQSETFKVMERRLMKAIINPAMIATLIFGLLLLLAQPELMRQGWMHAKLTFVLGLFALHGMMSGWLKAFAADRNRKSAKFFRIANEVPTALMILIVIMVIVRPF
jgi:putative membrane protein